MEAGCFAKANASLTTTHPTAICTQCVPTTTDLLVGGFPDPLNPNKTGDAWAGLGAGRKSNIMYGESCMVV
jgi:hypothetical protein